MKFALMGIAAAGAVLMAPPANAQQSNEKPAVQIEIRSTLQEARPETRVDRPATTPSTTGSGTVASIHDCNVITVRSAQPDGSTIIRKLTQCD